MAANKPQPGADVMWSMHGPKMPAQFSGAFIIATESRDYASAIVSRILGAAGLGGAGFGKVPQSIRIRTNGYEMQSVDAFANRPYIENSDRYAVSINSEPLATIIKLLSASDINKFLSAKEDFRLLALDTIEDSRKSDVPVLRFSQIWMAIERLIPFKMETTAQLALALSALEPISARFSKFKLIKKSYGLRSQIVHGYSFEKRESVHPELNEMARLFRRLFIVAMGVKSSDELKEILLAHVISGSPDRL